MAWPGARATYPDPCDPGAAPCCTLWQSGPGQPVQVYCDDLVPGPTPINAPSGYTVAFLAIPAGPGPLPAWLDATRPAMRDSGAAVAATVGHEVMHYRAAYLPDSRIGNLHGMTIGRSALSVRRPYHGRLTLNGNAVYVETV